jgi:hypothetical protein
MAPHPFSSALDVLRRTTPEQFSAAKPFSHIVLDNMFDQKLLADIHRLLHTLPDDYWEKNNDQGIEVKWRSKWVSEYSIPEPAREVVRFFNSGEFLRELSRIAGMKLIADPYLTGGGFNVIKRGGHLDVHVDGNWHDTMAVHRRLNLILYLNPNWREDWGGALNLYDSSAEKVEATIIPRGNRTIIFETHDYSFHGHPEPLACPEDEARTSIILYYYTATPRPADQISVSGPHSALWRSKAWTDKRGQKTRV